MRGFFIGNFAARYEEAMSRLVPMVTSGRLKYAEDILDGLEQAPTALIRAMTGDHFGVQLVKVSDAADR
jgi:NADPH-dependent curcumin reductase CurA